MKYKINKEKKCLKYQCLSKKYWFTVVFRAIKWIKKSRETVLLSGRAQIKAHHRPEIMAGVLDK